MHSSVEKQIYIITEYRQFVIFVILYLSKLFKVLSLDLKATLINFIHVPILYRTFKSYPNILQTKIKPFQRCIIHSKVTLRSLNIFLILLLHLQTLGCLNIKKKLRFTSCPPGNLRRALWFRFLNVGLICDKFEQYFIIAVSYYSLNSKVLSAEWEFGF